MTYRLDILYVKLYNIYYDRKLKVWTERFINYCCDTATETTGEIL